MIERANKIKSEIINLTNANTGLISTNDGITVMTPDS